MSIRATLLILSGLPDPTWALDGKEEDELRARLEPLVTRLSPAHPAMTDALGYRGIQLNVDGEEMFVTYGTLIVPRRGSTRGGDVLSLERWLLTTAKGRVDDAVIEAAEAALA